MAAKRAIGVDTRRSRPKRNTRVRFIKRSLLSVFILVLLCIIGILVWFMGAYRNAPDRMDALTRTVEALNTKPTEILASDGEVLFRVSSENRVRVKLSDVPVMARNAVIAAEDKRFYEHSGVDFIGIVRSMREVARTQRATQGASTLTMQLAKVLTDGSQKTLTRKMDDIALAIYMERQMTKDQILEMYLNNVYFGEGAYGIGAAARVYFDKDVKDLTLAEDAMLARCIRRPILNPIRNLQAATENRNLVLGIMRDEKMIDQSQYEEAVAEKTHVNPHPQKTVALKPNGADYFVDHVLDIVREQYPNLDLKTGGYTIETTLDSRIQRRAEEAIKKYIAEFHRQFHVNTGALVLIDKDGEILAEVGGANYRRNSYNAVSQGHMQPGSGFKPFVYASAFKDGVLQSPDDFVSNAPIRQRDPSQPSGWWTPHNDSKRMNAAGYTVRTALAESINLPAIHTIEKEGPERVVEYAHDNFGFQSKLQANPTLALGSSEVSPLEMAEGYSVFMLRGDRVRPFAIKRIIGPDGSVVAEFQPQVFHSVWDTDACERMDGLLQDVVRHGTAAVLPDGTALAAAIPDARGKTGTTSNNTDAWFNGYADGLLEVVWCANEQKEHGVYVRKRMSSSAFGATVALPIWKDVMELALKVHPEGPIAAAPTDSSATDQAAAKFKSSDDNGDSQASGDQPTPDNSPQQPADIPKSPTDNPDGTAGQTPAAPPTDSPGVTGTPPPSASPGQPSPTKTGTSPTASAASPPNGGAPASTAGGGTGTATAAGGASSSSTSGTAGGTSKSGAAQTIAKPARTAKKRSSGQDQYVTLEICDQTGLRATIYCPETTFRTYKKGTEPKKYCNVHTGNR